LLEIFSVHLNSDRHGSVSSWAHWRNMLPTKLPLRVNFSALCDPRKYNLSTEFIKVAIDRG